MQLKFYDDIYRNYGWTCPGCKAVYGPHVDECSRCAPPWSFGRVVVGVDPIEPIGDSDDVDGDLYTHPYPRTYWYWNS